MTIAEKARLGGLGEAYSVMHRRIGRTASARRFLRDRTGDVNGSYDRTLRKEIAEMLARRTFTQRRRDWKQICAAFGGVDKVPHALARRFRRPYVARPMGLRIEVDLKQIRAVAFERFAK
jgi:hypothetical protein